MEHVWWGLGLLVVALTTFVLARLARVRLGWLPVTAILRASVQLAAVALILRGVLAPGLWLQRLTTREPSLDQVEVSIRALREVLRLEGRITPEERKVEVMA